MSQGGAFVLVYQIETPSEITVGVQKFRSAAFAAAVDEIERWMTTWQTDVSIVFSRSQLPWYA